jgi:hypothetical protein
MQGFAAPALRTCCERTKARLVWRSRVSSKYQFKSPADGQPFVQHGRAGTGVYFARGGGGAPLACLVANSGLNPTGRHAAFAWRRWRPAG